MEHPDNTTRRGFLSVLTGVLASVPVLGGLYVALRAALAPAGSVRPDKFELCRVDEIPEDGLLERPVSFRMRRGPLVEVVSRVVFVTRDPADPESIIAMSGECTHLTCPVQLRTVEKGEPGDGPPLRCPCHGGAFSRTGEVLAGPPPRPLRRLAIEVPESGEGMIYLLDL
jgi:Rieske Fe-S protein